MTQIEERKRPEHDFFNDEEYQRECEKWLDEIIGIEVVEDNIENRRFRVNHPNLDDIDM